MACLGDCFDMSPPPDSILFMPPPPAPLFMFPNLDTHNSTSCLACDAATYFLNHKGIYKNLDRIEYNEMPSTEAEAKWNVSGIGDTWLFVLVGSSIGVLLLGALLAMFLLKCREMHLFASPDHCSLRGQDLRALKHLEQNNTLANGSSKLIHPINSSFYTPTPNLQDNRMVWAAITPRGTEHFISENFSRNLMCYEPTEDHYETIDNLPVQHQRSESNGHVAYYGYHKTYDYEDPTPLIDNYQMDNIEYVGDHQYQIIGNNDMRCATLAYAQHPLARQMTLRKPMVSPPTRIEHPNLPPLNMLPQRSANNTLKKNTMNYRTMDPGKLPKYGL